MKQAGYSRRPRGRSSERFKQPQKSGQYENRDTKVRGNPQQYVDKYLNLARDATASGDPISAESYYQYADHYYRMVVALRPSRMARTTPKPESKEVETPKINEPSPKKQSVKITEEVQP